MDLFENKNQILYFNSIQGLIEHLNKIKKSCFFLCDQKTFKHCFFPFFKDLFDSEKVFTLESGEKSKTGENALKICAFLANQKADRNSVLINLGGGMITDIGAFSASIFKRGIEFINIPTSTLAMADAAIGGKNGVNLPYLKNAIGTFNFTGTTLVYPKFLETLPEREHIAGFAEISKSLLLFDQEKWVKFCEKGNIPTHNNPEFAEYLGSAINAKLETIQKDPYEKNIRKALNYGHSIGHAIEAVYQENGIDILHGEAIGLGMQIENRIAVKLGIMQPKICEEINENLSKFYNLKLKQDLVGQMLDALKNDKKNKHNTIRTSLIEKPGNFLIDVDVSEETVEEILKKS